MANGGTISRVINIVRSDEQRRYIVVSAPGKEMATTSKSPTRCTLASTKREKKAIATSLSIS